MHLAAAEAIIIVGDLCRSGTTVMSDPYVEGRLRTTKGAGLVACAVDMQDGNGSYVSIGGSTTHRIATTGGKGCDEVGNLVHGVIGQHAAHGESAQIDAVTVNLMLCHHLVDDGFDKVNVAIATGVP